MDPRVCSGLTVLMMAVIGTVRGGRFPTPTLRVSAEEAEKWPCTWAGGTVERTRSLEPKRLGVGQAPRERRRPGREAIFNRQQTEAETHERRQRRSNWVDVRGESCRWKGEGAGQERRDPELAPGVCGLQPPSCLQASLPLLPTHSSHRGQFSSVQFSPVAQSCLTLYDPMDCSTPGLPVHHQLPEFT